MTPNDETDEEEEVIEEQTPQDDIIKHLPHRQTINELQAKCIQQLIQINQGERRTEGGKSKMCRELRELCKDIKSKKEMKAAQDQQANSEQKHSLQMVLSEKSIHNIRKICMRPNQEIVTMVADATIVEVSKIKQLMASGSPISKDMVNTYLEIFCSECLGMYYLKLHFFSLWRDN